MGFFISARYFFFEVLKMWRHINIFLYNPAYLTRYFNRTFPMFSFLARLPLVDPVVSADRSSLLRSWTTKNQNLKTKSTKWKIKSKDFLSKYYKITTNKRTKATIYVNLASKHLLLPTCLLHRKNESFGSVSATMLDITAINSVHQREVVRRHGCVDW